MTDNNPLSTILNAFVSISKGPAPKLARDEVGSLTVSTIRSYDMGRETAILDASGHTIPVERYPEEAGDEGALAGHKAWVEKVKDPALTKVFELGYGVVPGEWVELKRERKVN